MLIAFCRQFRQGIYVAGCASMSAMTMGFMMLDIHKTEKKQLQNEYENRIKVLNDEIKMLKN